MGAEFASAEDFGLGEAGCDFRADGAVGGGVPNVLEGEERGLDAKRASALGKELEGSGVDRQQFCGDLPSSVEPVGAGENRRVECAPDGFEVVGVFGRIVCGCLDALAHVAGFGGALAASGEHPGDELAVLSCGGERSGLDAQRSGACVAAVRAVRFGSAIGGFGVFVGFTAVGGRHGSVSSADLFGL